MRLTHHIPMMRTYSVALSVLSGTDTAQPRWPDTKCSNAVVAAGLTVRIVKPSASTQYNVRSASSIHTAYSCPATKASHTFQSLLRANSSAVVRAPCMPLAFPLPLATTGEPPALPSICVQTATAQSAAENMGRQFWGRDTHFGLRSTLQHGRRNIFLPSPSLDPRYLGKT